jgi:cell division protein FtsW
MEAARPREGFDRGLLIVTIVLLLLGVVAVLDASFARDLHSKGTGFDAFFSFKRQAMWSLGAILSLVVGMRFPLERLRRFWMAGLVLSAVLLVVVMVPHVGIEVNGSRRWLGFGPIRFQPSEFAKIALVVFLARYSELWRGRITNLTRGFIPPVLAVLSIGVLIAKEDLGTAITVIGTGLLLIFMMGARPQHVLGLVGLAVLGGVALVLHERYRMERIYGWMDLLANPLHVHPDRAYQPWQGLLAVGSGGLFGRGIGLGTAKHLYLPAEHTDYIFATIGEEFGYFWGCLPLLGLFAFLVIRGLTIAHRATDWYGSLVAAGLTCIIGLQAVLNIAVVAGLVPCTGVPLPFISYGGSSLIFTTLAIGMVLNVSQQSGQAALAANEKRDVRESPADGWRHRRPHLSRT